MNKNKNLLLFYMQEAAYACLSLITVGTIFQTFMIECGIDGTRVSFCVTAFQAIQTFTMILASKFVENIRNINKALSITYFSFSLILVPMLLISLKPNMSVDFKYISLFLTGSVVSIFLGLLFILVYKRPHHIMDIKEYGKALGQAGVISGVLGIAVTALITFAVSRFSYFGTITVVCVFGLGLSIMAGVIGFFYTPVKQEKLLSKENNKINIFKYKPFWQLLIPNFMRGFSEGIFGLIAIIGYHCEILDSTSATILVTVSQVATLVSSQTFVFISKKRKNGLLCIISSIVVLVTLPLMLLGGMKTIFAVFYFVAFVFVTYIGNAIPVIVVEHIDYGCLGQYTAWRMALYKLGLSVGSFVVPVSLMFTGALGTLVLCGLTMLPCSVGYYIFEKSRIFKNAN